MNEPESSAYNYLNNSPEDIKTGYIPMLLLYVILLMEYIRPPFLPPQITLGFALLVLIFAIFVRAKGSIPVIQIKLLFLFNAICIASIVFAIFFNKTVELNITLAKEIYSAVLGYSILTYAMVYVIDSYKKLAHFFGVLVFLMFLVAILNLESISNIQRGYIQIAGVFLVDGNDYALATVVIIPLVFFLLTYSNSKAWKIASFSALVLLGLTIILTQSRGGILGLIGVFAFLSFFSKRRMQMIVLTAIVGIIVIAIFGNTYLTRMDTLSNYEADSSAMGRIYAWKAALGMVRDNPLLGIGIGNFAWAYGLYYKPPEVTWMVWRAAHSFFFQVLGELGILGITCYIALIVSNFRYAWKIFRQAIEHNDAIFDRLGKSIFASQLGFLISGAFLSTAYYPHLFIISGIIAVSYKLFMNTLQSEVTPTIFPS